METAVLILIATVLANNFVLHRFLGLCPFIGASARLDGARGMAAATLLVLTLASIAGHVVYRYLLVPLAIEYLATLTFILIIAALVQAVELIVRATSPLVERILGLYLPLITTNCAVLGVALLNVRQERSLLEAAWFGFGAGLGFALVLLAFAALRERADRAPVPAVFRGAPLALLTAGLMAIAFTGFGGMAGG